MEHHWPETMASPRENPIVEFATAQAWSEWLAENHRSSGGAWLKIAKRGASTATVSYAEALEEALCFGWIDGQKAAFDEHFFLQRFTPRKPRSRWSQINCKKVELLIEQGRMRSAGLAQVEAARTDGRWERAYAPQSTAAVPEDLQRALDANPAAKEFFETLSGANRYAILYRIQDAKRPETRAKRIAQYVEMCAERRTLH